MSAQMAEPRPQQNLVARQQQNEPQAHVPSERLSLPAVSTRVVPILSSTGEPVFEVGLNGSSAQEHILPVFKLPQVDDNTEFVNRIPTELNALEAEREEEDNRDDEELAASLGLTVEELTEFQMEAAERTGNKRALRRAWESQRSLLTRDGAGPDGSRTLSSNGSHFGMGTSELRPQGLPELQLGPLDDEDSSTTDLDRLTGGPLKRRRPGNSDVHGGRRTPRCLRPGASASRAQLRGELKKSIDMIHYLTEQVRDDIARVHETVPIQSVKAQLFMQRWGLEKFQKIFFRIQMSFLIAAFRKWHNTIEHMKHEEKRQQYMKLKASKNLKHLGNRLRNKEIHHAFTIWSVGVEKQKRKEEFERTDSAARKIQNAARCYIARVVMKDLRARLKREEERQAATKIQAVFRGRSTRKQVAELLTQIETNRAVLCVQRAWRGRMGRIMYREAQRKAAELRAVLMVQNAWRGRHARAMMAAMRENRKRNNAATILQSHFRRMLARKALGSRKERHRQDKAAALIQARMRGKMTRRSVAILAAKRNKQRDKENKAATLIQTHFRAHKAYITYMLKVQAHRASMVKLHAAATRVQAIYRGRLARRLVADMSGENHDEMVERAREYMEIWDEDSQGYFYYRSLDEQAVWEPPSQGYTKADGKLVLRNGEVIPDPAVDPAANAKKCIECETELAARYCVDCDDNYCDSCFDKTHNAGKRALHSWEPIGPTRCMECEQEVATRWCDTCGKSVISEIFPLVNDDNHRFVILPLWTRSYILNSLMIIKQKPTLDHNTTQTILTVSHASRQFMQRERKRATSGRQLAKRRWKRKPLRRQRVSTMQAVRGAWTVSWLQRQRTSGKSIGTMKQIVLTGIMQQQESLVILIHLENQQTTRRWVTAAQRLTRLTMTARLGMVTQATAPRIGKRCLTRIQVRATGTLSPQGRQSGQTLGRVAGVVVLLLRPRAMALLHMVLRVTLLQTLVGGLKLGMMMETLTIIMKQQGNRRTNPHGERGQC